MKIQFRTLTTVAVLSTLISLSGCGTLFDKDNTPPPAQLITFKPEIKITDGWSARATDGTSDDNLKLLPAVDETTLYTASKRGFLTATQLQDGKTRWQVDTGIEITAGPNVYGKRVLVAGINGEVIALNTTNGTQLWKTAVSSEVLAAPAQNDQVILVKSMDGRIHALSPEDGHTLWNFQQAEPSLILRGSSQPLLIDDSTVVGFANGHLVKLNLKNGTTAWEQVIAMPEGTFSIERMVDIDANPISEDHSLYAATYQGKIASLDFTTGQLLWSHDLSTFSGMTADSNKVYVTDAKSHVWAFDAATGAVLWRQIQLDARTLTGPVIMGNYIVVGDAEGYLHWLSKDDGHFIARKYVDNSGLLATPVVDQKTIYAVARNGYVAAFTVDQ